MRTQAQSHYTCKRYTPGYTKTRKPGVFHHQRLEWGASLEGCTSAFRCRCAMGSRSSARRDAFLYHRNAVLACVGRGGGAYKCKHIS